MKSFIQNHTLFYKLFREVLGKDEARGLYAGLVREGLHVEAPLLLGTSPRIHDTALRARAPGRMSMKPWIFLAFCLSLLRISAGFGRTASGRACSHTPGWTCRQTPRCARANPPTSRSSSPSAASRHKRVFSSRLYSRSLRVRNLTFQNFR